MMGPARLDFPRGSHFQEQTMKKVSVALTVLALVFAVPAIAGPDKGKGKGRGEGPPAAERSTGDSRKGKPGKREFSRSERDEIHAYFSANPGAREQLPPGLAKKNKIPPGWQKKIARGERIPDDVWAYRVLLPHEILVRLPPPPTGVIHVRIQDHVLKVVEKTHEVLDDLGLPHPPTPTRSRLPR